MFSKLTVLFYNTIFTIIYSSRNFQCFQVCFRFFFLINSTTWYRKQFYLAFKQHLLKKKRSVRRPRKIPDVSRMRHSLTATYNFGIRQRFGVTKWREFVDVTAKSEICVWQISHIPTAGACFDFGLSSEI